MARKKKKNGKKYSSGDVAREAACMHASAEADKVPSRQKEQVFKKTLADAIRNPSKIPDIFMRRCRRS